MSSRLWTTRQDPFALHTGPNVSKSMRVLDQYPSRGPCLEQIPCDCHAVKGTQDQEWSLCSGVPQVSCNASWRRSWRRSTRRAAAPCCTCLRRTFRHPLLLSMTRCAPGPQLTPVSSVRRLGVAPLALVGPATRQCHTHAADMATLACTEQLHACAALMLIGGPGRMPCAGPGAAAGEHADAVDAARARRGRAPGRGRQRRQRGAAGRAGILAHALRQPVRHPRPAEQRRHAQGSSHRRLSTPQLPAAVGVTSQTLACTVTVWRPSSTCHGCDAL